jgi:hypothetical protein
MISKWDGFDFGRLEVNSGAPEKASILSGGSPLLHGEESCGIEP